MPKNILLITSNINLDKEPGRLLEEAQKQGFSLSSYDTHDFSFWANPNSLEILNFPKSKPDFVITKSIFNSLRQVIEIIKSIRAQNIPTFDNNLVSHGYSINKVTDLMVLAKSGLPIPRTFYSRHLDNYLVAADKLGYPVVVKPANTGRGNGVTKLNSPEELRTYLDNFLLPEAKKKTLIMQQFIPYQLDLRILIIGEQVFCMRRTPPAGDFRANFSIGGTVENFNPTPEIITLAKQAMSAIGLLVAGVDILVTKDGHMSILEVNHNPGFLGMEQATSKNIAKIYFDYALKLATTH